MVKKRLRTSRKESSDENDSDSDFGDDPPYDPAPKKYSLRQRKRTTFTDADFQYDDEELPPELSSELSLNLSPKPPSEDANFEVHKELQLDQAPESKIIAPSTYINSIEPENSEAPEDTEELVDFEDMIRADIVVNKNRIDYDNVIQKTEIKVQPLSESEKLSLLKNKPKTKRGRKPKRRNSDMDEGHFLAPLIQEEGDEDYHPYKPKRERRQKKRAEGEIDSSLLEPEMEVQEEYEDKDDEDYNPDDDLDYPLIEQFLATSHDETKITAGSLAHSQDDNEELVCSAISTKYVETSNAESVTRIPSPPPIKNATRTNSEVLEPTKTLNDNEISLEETMTSNSGTNSGPVTSNPDSSESNVLPEKSIHVNGTMAQLEKPEEEADDDVVLIDDTKYDVIVLDD